MRVNHKKNCICVALYYDIIYSNEEVCEIEISKVGK